MTTMEVVVIAAAIIATLAVISNITNAINIRLSNRKRRAAKAARWAALTPEERDAESAEMSRLIESIGNRLESFNG